MGRAAIAVPVPASDAPFQLDSDRLLAVLHRELVLARSLPLLRQSARFLKDLLCSRWARRRRLGRVRPVAVRVGIEDRRHRGRLSEVQDLLLDLFEARRVRRQVDQQARRDVRDLRGRKGQQDRADAVAELRRRLVVALVRIRIAYDKVATTSDNQSDSCTPETQLTRDNREAEGADPIRQAAFQPETTRESRKGRQARYPLSLFGIKDVKPHQARQKYVQAVDDFVRAGGGRPADAKSGQAAGCERERRREGRSVDVALLQV